MSKDFRFVMWLKTGILQQSVKNTWGIFYVIIGSTGPYWINGKNSFRFGEGLSEWVYQLEVLLCA